MAKKKNIFISHSCKDHEIVYPLGEFLQQEGWGVMVDPFAAGDRTCAKAQKMIKETTHFVLINTANSVNSRWVFLEALFSKLCYDQKTLHFFPVDVGNVASRKETEELIALKWEPASDISELFESVKQAIEETTPKKARLSTNQMKSERIKEKGRELERMHFRTGDWKYNLEAIETYQEAILLDFCNHNAWANQAWCLWKQHEDYRAYKCIDVAEKISPTSNHVRDVKKRIRSGSRRMG